MNYIGIDPGKSGALAIIEDCGCVSVVPFDGGLYADALEGLPAGECRCCLERVGAMPKQGVSSMFRFGENFGFIQGLLTAFHIPFQLVPPRKWKGEFGLNSDKQKSIDVCRRLFPEVDLHRTERCRTDDDGMAEALLMAEYARRKM